MLEHLKAGDSLIVMGLLDREYQAREEVRWVDGAADFVALVLVFWCVRQPRLVGRQALNESRKAENGSGLARRRSDRGVLV